MKKILVLAVLIAGFIPSLIAQGVYKGSKTTVSFYSHTALEDISAVDTIATFLLNTKTSDVIASVNIKGFDFPNELMEEHFNENYMESDKYPNAQFKGKIQEAIDYNKDGTHAITMKGDLTVHGVTKPRTITGTLTIKGGVITVDCKFNIPLADHNIAVPEAVGQKIAESIEVTVHSQMIDPKRK